ncbi:MAG: sodium:solute symporter family protein [Pirellulaceae bacterium]
MTQLVIIAIYLSLLLGLGIFASRLFSGTSKDYMLASHSIGPFLLLMSLFGTTMTAFALVGSTGEAYKVGIGVYGMLASSSGIIHSLCFYLIGVRLWTFGRKYGYTTQIQYFRDRLQNDKIGLLLFPILVGLVIPYLLIGVLASGTVINAVTEGAFRHEMFARYDYGLPNWLGSAVICSVVLGYVFMGGMRGTAWANAFQTLVFMVLGVITFFLISDKLGGPKAASLAVQEKHPSKLIREITDEEKKSAEKALGVWEGFAKYQYAAAHKNLKLTDAQVEEAESSFPDAKKKLPGWQRKAQAVFADATNLVDLDKNETQLAYIEQDDRIAPKNNDSLFDDDGEPVPIVNFSRNGVWVGDALELMKSRIGHPNDPLDPDDPTKGKKWTRRRAMGAYKVINWRPEQRESLPKLMFFTYLLIPLSVGMFPHLFQHWLTAKSADSFKLPIVAHPLFIMIVWVPCVLVGIWATSAVIDGRSIIPPQFSPNAVLPKMVKDLTNPVIGGFLTAGILAAIMSSLDSQFLCLGTMFTSDIAVHYGGKDRFTDKQQVVMARLFIVAIVVVTYLLSLTEPRRVFQMGVWCFSGFSSLFPLVFAAVYWRRLTAAGAFAGVIAAFGSWCYLFWKSQLGLIPNYSVDFTMGGAVYQTMPVVTMIVASTLAMVLVSLATRPPNEETVRRFFPD